MIRIALIDGPLDGPDTLARQHALAMRSAIRSNCPNAQIVPIPIFEDGLSTSLARVVAALDEAARRDAQVVHCSFGMARADITMTECLNRVLCTGARIVAARPARGTQTVWPASQPGVFSVQGDARCGPQSWSLLGRGDLWFGACPSLGADLAIAGASVAAAHFTGLLASQLARSVPPARAGDHMARTARFFGRERKNPRIAAGNHD